MPILPMMEVLVPGRRLCVHIPKEYMCILFGKKPLFKGTKLPGKIYSKFFYSSFVITLGHTLERCRLKQPRPRPRPRLLVLYSTFFILEKAQAWAFGPLGPNPLSGPQGPKQTGNKNMGLFSFSGLTWVFWAPWALPPCTDSRIKKSRGFIILFCNGFIPLDREQKCATKTTMILRARSGVCTRATF